MSKSPSLYFTGCKMSSLGGSNTVLNTMTVDKVFCKSTYSGFDKSIVNRKGKSIYILKKVFAQ